MGRAGRWDRAMALVLGACAGIVVLVAAGLLFTLVAETVHFFSQVSVVEFFTGTRWTPLFREKHFGLLPLFSASFLLTAGAGLVALPLGLLTAIFMSEYAGSRLRSGMQGALEILAVVPTVAYGYLAFTLVTPALRLLLPGMEVFNGLSASLVLGIMILPTVAILSARALARVPESIREAAFGLGATRMEVVTRVVVPTGLPGVLAAFVLALSRALGETMIVALAAGNSPRMAVNPLEAVQTMTAYLLQVGTGDTSPETVEYGTLFAVGLTLFLLTMAMNLAGHWLLSRNRVVES